MKHFCGRSHAVVGLERARYAELGVKVCSPPRSSPAETWDLNHRSSSYTQKRLSSLRYLLIWLGALVAISIIIGIVSAFAYTRTVTFNGKLKATLDPIADGTFRLDVQSLLLSPESALFVPPCLCIVSDALCSQLAMGSSLPRMGAPSNSSISNLTSPRSLYLKVDDVKDASVPCSPAERFVLIS